MLVEQRPVPVVRGSAHALTCAVLSTYPPTACGIATFSAALCAGLGSVGIDVGVVAVGHPDGPADPLVVTRLDERDPGSRSDSVAVMEWADLVIVQHEYGIYGGADGESVAALLEQVSTPTIVVAHTVLARPTPHQREVLERVAACRRRGRGDDRGWSSTPHQRLRRGSPQGRGDPARCRSGAGRGRQGPLGCAHPAHLGAARPGQGHRVGHRRVGPARRPRPPPALPHRRRHPSEGGGCRRRVVPGDARAPGPGRRAWGTRSPSTPATAASTHWGR